MTAGAGEYALAIRGSPGATGHGSQNAMRRDMDRDNHRRIAEMRAMSASEYVTERLRDSTPARRAEANGESAVDQLEAELWEAGAGSKDGIPDCLKW